MISYSEQRPHVALAMAKKKPHPQCIDQQNVLLGACVHHPGPDFPRPSDIWSTLPSSQRSLVHPTPLLAISYQCFASSILSCTSLLYPFYSRTSAYLSPPPFGSIALVLQFILCISSTLCCLLPHPTYNLILALLPPCSSGPSSHYSYHPGSPS